MSNFCHPENPGPSHWLGCACSESAWAEKLAAAEARIRKLESVGNAREAEVTAHMEARYAAEERARRLEEALRNAVEMIHDANGPLEYAKANDWMRGQLRSLTPPPEAAPAYRQMTPEEDAAQRRSFACGNAKLANEDVTREMFNPPPEAAKRGEG